MKNLLSCLFLLSFAVVVTISAAQAATDAPLQLASVAGDHAAVAPVERVSSYGLARDDRPPDELRLNLDGRDVVIIYATGEVQLPEGLTVDDASRAFWKRVGELAPSFCRARAAEQAASPRR